MLLVTTLLFIPLIVFAQDSRWSFELRTGSALSFDSNLKIEQSGFPELSFDADYETRPFEDAFYYGWRVSYRNPNHAWEVELIHHKVYLKNTRPEVEYFEVSHGYNLLLVNYSRDYGGLNLRAGAGPVISHAESEIRNKSFSSNYEFSGLCGQFAIDKRFYLGQRFFLTVEGKFTAARATVSIADGEATVPNVAIHGLIGFGVDL
jgi:hypothetical protein